MRCPMTDRLVINATILNNPDMIGLGVYAHNILRHLLPLLLETKEVKSIVLLGDAHRMKSLFPEDCRSERVEIRHISTTNPIVRLISLHRAVKKLRSENDLLFYSPAHHGVSVKGVKQIVTILDVFPLLFPTNYRQQYYYFKYILPRTLSRTATVVTSSASSARDIAELYTAQCKCVTIPCGLRDEFLRVTPGEIPGLAGRKFFLFVGPSLPHKNCERLIDAFVRFSAENTGDDYALVFGGGKEPYLGRVKAHAAAVGGDLSKRILFTGHIVDEELAWLYVRAQALMITTLYEGFGLPALEAMHFGCPVVASDRGSLPEVCGSAALFVNPEEVIEISLAMRRISRDHTLRHNLQKLGRENLKRFSWDIAAREVCEVLLRQ